MRNRIPFLKGDSTESANPFGEEDEDDIPEEGRGGGAVGGAGGIGGGNRKNGALAEEEEEEEEEDKNEFDLPEWLAELPDDLEASTELLYLSTVLSSLVSTPD